MSVRRRARKAVQERRENRQNLLKRMESVEAQLREKVRQLQAEQAANKAACSPESENASHD